jgi:hypothetical protein
VILANVRKTAGRRKVHADAAGTCHEGNAINKEIRPANTTRLNFPLDTVPDSYCNNCESSLTSFSRKLGDSMIWFTACLFVLGPAIGQTTPTPLPSKEPSELPASATTQSPNPSSIPSSSPSPSPAPSAAQSPTAVPTPSPAKKKVTKKSSPAGWGVLAGLNFGTFTEGAVKGPEGFAAHSGSIYGGQITATNIQKNYVLDLLLGLRIAAIEGVEPDATKPQSRVDAEVNTTAGVFGVAARYRLFSLLEFGLGLNEWFAKDLSFSAFETEPAAATFLELQLAGLFFVSNWPLRAKLGAEMDLTYSERQIMLYTLSVDGGMLFGKKAASKKKPITQPTP